MNTVIKISAFCLGFAIVGTFAAESTSDSTQSEKSRENKESNQVSNINQKVNEIHQALVASPLDGKNWGVEVDPVLLLFTTSSTALIFGTVSNFSFSRSAELAFPFAYVHVDDGSDNSETSFSLDAHYRYFLGEIQRGFYVSGFARYQLEKYKTYTYDGSSFVPIPKTINSNRLGIGFEIGDRIFSRKGLYWGWSLCMGRFLTGTSDASTSGFSGAFDDFIFDAELLKIGFAF